MEYLPDIDWFNINYFSLTFKKSTISNGNCNLRKCNCFSDNDPTIGSDAILIHHFHSFIYAYFFLWFSLSVIKNFKTNQVFPLNLLKSLIQFDINQNSLYFVLFQVQRHFIVTIHCTIEMKYQTLVLLYWIESITLILMQAYCWNSLHVCENKLIQYIRR